MKGLHEVEGSPAALSGNFVTLSFSAYLDIVLF